MEVGCRPVLARIFPFIPMNWGGSGVWRVFGPCRPYFQSYNSGLIKIIGLPWQVGFDAGVAQLVEHHVANVIVDGSSPFTRSFLFQDSSISRQPLLFPPVRPLIRG